MEIENIAKYETDNGPSVYLQRLSYEKESVYGFSRVTVEAKKPTYCVMMKEQGNFVNVFFRSKGDAEACFLTLLKMDIHTT